MVDSVKNSFTIETSTTKKGNNMQRNIFTTRSARRAAILDTIGALALIGASVVMLLAYFDVLTK